MTSIDPAALLLLLLLAGLHARAVRRLRARGRRVPRAQIAAWYAGLALIAAGLLGPIDRLSEELLTAHMTQHLLIADLGAPLVLAGLRTPVLQWVVPRAVLAATSRRRRLRTTLRLLRRPPVAIAVWVLALYGWHFEPLFEAALRHPAVHVLQHQSFVAASVLVWWAALEPSRRRFGGELWKIGHVLGARLAGMFLGMAFITMRSPLYAPHYDGARGLSALHDQQIAGGLMLSLDVLVMLFAVAFFFWRAGEDHDRAESAARADVPATTRG